MPRDSLSRVFLTHRTSFHARHSKMIWFFQKTSTGETSTSSVFNHQIWCQGTAHQPMCRTSSPLPRTRFAWVASPDQSNSQLRKCLIVTVLAMDAKVAAAIEPSPGVRREVSSRSPVIQTLASQESAQKTTFSKTLADRLTISIDLSISALLPKSLESRKRSWLMDQSLDSWLLTQTF